MRPGFADGADRMDRALKQRMVGAIVLIALAVIFIPMLLDGGTDETRRSVSLDIPSKPDQKYRSRLLPLDEEQPRERESPGNGQGRVQRTPSSAEPVPAPGEDEPVPESEDAAPFPDEVNGKEQVADVPAQQDEATTREGPPDRQEANRGGALANWFVQVGSFTREGNAVDLRDRLREAGFTAFTETSTVDGTTTHRVKVGPEMDRSDAEATREEIANRFNLKGIVVSDP